MVAPGVDLSIDQVLSTIAINNPFSSPELWDVIKIAGNVSPGVCKVGDFKRAYEWDVKKGKGAQSSNITYQGRKPAKGTITFYLWAAEHFAQWSDFIKLLQYDPTKVQISAVDIVHPGLNFVGIHSVVTESIGNIIHEGKQYYSIKVDFLEYFPPNNASAVSTPKKSTDLELQAKFGAKPPAQPTAPSAAAAAMKTSLGQLANAKATFDKHRTGPQ